MNTLLRKITIGGWRTAAAAAALAFVLAACADEELPPPTAEVGETPAPILQPAEEPTQIPAAPAELAVEGSYPAPVENETAVVTEGYPAAEPAAQNGYPAAEEGEPPAGEGLGGEVQTFVVVPENSSAQYEVDEEFFNRDVRFVTALGTTSAINGNLVVDLTGPVPVIVDGQFTVDISTLTSDSSRRDNAIREDWLESNTYPEAIFVAREVAAFPDSYVPGEPVEFQLVGDLTIREITNEVTWDVVAQHDGPTLTATATSFIFMTDYGFEPPTVFGILEVTDGVTVTVDLTAQAP